MTRKILFILIFLTSCKNEYHKILNTYSNGEIQEEEIYPNKTDTNYYRWLTYFENKNKQTECEIRNNKFVGKKITYWENGNVKQIESLVAPSDLGNCCADAFVERFDSIGRKTEDFHNKNGVENGIVKVYHANGKPRDVYEMKDGSINGTRFVYDTSGILNNTSTFVNGYQTGIICFFSEQGDTSTYFTFVENQLSLPCKKWLKNGIHICGFKTMDNLIKWEWRNKSDKIIKTRLEKYDNKFNFPE